MLAQQGLVLAVTLSDSFLAGNFRPPNPEQHVSYQAAQTTANYLQLVHLQLHHHRQRRRQRPWWPVSSAPATTPAPSASPTSRCFWPRRWRCSAHSVVGLGGLRPLVSLLQLNGDAADFAVDYLRPLFVLLVFQVVEAAGIACLVGAGDTRTGLWVRLFVAVINLPLAWGLCLGLGPLPELGFVGIAIGHGAEPRARRHGRPAPADARPVGAAPAAAAAAAGRGAAAAAAAGERAGGASTACPWWSGSCGS